MASRYKITSTPQDIFGSLEIRGVSRGSIIDRKNLQGANSGLDLLPSGRENSSNLESDDESTVKDESSGDEYSPRKVLPGEDALTVSESSHYWSGANSSTTGNTTERSSLYSWGDDVLDHKTSRDVQEMFHAIERMLFESVLSGSSLLQQECREWMDAFPHLRIRGKQTFPVKDEGFQSHPTSRNTSGLVTPVSELPMSDDAENLSLTGTSVAPSAAPIKYYPFEEKGDDSVQPDNLSYLHEEIFEQDGEVEEYLAYDIREMDEEDTVKRYHVPRRRRLGYPPITPNACVRDAVINQLFDSTWIKLISNLGKVKMENGSLKKSTKSLWRVLFESYSSMSRQVDSSKFAANEAYLYRDGSQGPYDADDRHGLGFAYGSGFLEDRNTGILMSQSEHFQTNMPPPSREYLDPSRVPVSGRRRHIPHKDFTFLNSLITIQRKELLARHPDPSLDAATPTERPVVIPRAAISRVQLPGSSSPQVYPFLPNNTSRQPGSAKNRAKGKHLGPPKLQPLDRARTPTATLDWTLQAKKIPRPSDFGLSNLDEQSEMVGIRITSPTDPPPTAPAVPGGSLYPKLLPPLHLQSLNENSSIEFGKKTRRIGRISSALAEDTNKQNLRGWEGTSRPNTTHAFRNDPIFKQRALSITPSNFSSRPMIGRGIQPIKSSSPTGLAPIAGGNLFYAHNLSQSPDNHIRGLAHGIHGIGMMGHTSTSHSPHEHDDDGRRQVWAGPVGRRPVIGN